MHNNSDTNKDNKFNVNYYENYEEPNEEIDRISNMQFFEPSERHHIASLVKRRNVLKVADKKNEFGTGGWNELQALNWVLTVLEEISEE